MSWNIPIQSADVLRVVRLLTEQHGKPPTQREVMARLGTKSSRVFSACLDRLELRGEISRKPLRVTTKGAP